VVIPSGRLDTVGRPRLTQQLDACDVGVVIAPAGYGKTTLLVEWARVTTRTVAWLSLSEADGDPVRFLLDLTTSLQVASARANDTLGHLGPLSGDADLGAYVAALQDGLAEGDAPSAIVIDDVHVVASADRTLELLDLFMQGLPERVQLLLAARRLPRLRLPRLRLERRVVTVEASSLTFTPTETAAAVLEVHPGVTLEAVAEIHRASGGWPVAVRLCALASGSGQDISVITGGGSGDITDYLVTEVLQAVDTEVRAFVLDSSVDEIVCAQLLDEIRARADSADLLERCSAAGLFLTVEDQKGSDLVWFRWHHLFVAHVRRMAEREDAARQRVLHGRAATWWRQIDAVNAVGHALRAGRPELGAELAADAWPDLVLAGMTATVAELVQRLPAGLPHEAEMHLAAAFAAAYDGDLARTRYELDLARATSDRLSEAERARFEARAAALSLLFLVSDQAALQTTVDRGRELLRRLEGGPWTPDPVTVTLTRLCVGMGEARLQQENHHALALLRSAAAGARERGLTGVELVALAETCIPTIATNALDAAATVADQVLAAAATKGWGLPRALAPAVAYRGWFSFWQGDLSAAIEAFTSALSLLRTNDWTLVGLTAYFRAQAYVHSGEPERAEGDLKILRELADTGAMAPYWPSLVAATEAELLLLTGQRAEAAVRASVHMAGRQYRLATTSSARVLLRVGQQQEALALLGEIAPEDDFVHVRALALRLRAEALLQLDRSVEAHHAIEEALVVAAPLGLALPFLLDGLSLRPLLRAHAAVTACPAFLATILQGALAAGPSPVADGPHLSPRELTFLRYLPTTMTLGEIAAAEFVSVNTVKTHVGSLYRKLGVATRREAARKAISEGLL
jgi:LuxR family maltose regulon positive regulatory protein